MPVAIVLVDHGSRVAAANQVVADVAAELRRTLDDGTLTFHAHQDVARPTLDEAIDAAVAAGASEVTVVPFFLTPGRHASEDVPRLVRDALTRHPGVRWRVTAPLGSDVRSLAAHTARIARG